jgi:hypothetical protein
MIYSLYSVMSFLPLAARVVVPVPASCHLKGFTQTFRHRGFWRAPTATDITIQARGVIAQWATRRIGRVMLRGVVRVRHMALTASAALEAGAGQPPQHTGSTGATWNEWDSGDRAWVPQSS